MQGQSSDPPTPPLSQTRDEHITRFHWISIAAERPERYRPQGFHPVHIGDTLSDGEDYNFRVIRKLGYGGSSTAWLAKDERNGKLVAIKVTRANHRKEIENEITTYRKLYECLRHSNADALSKLLHLLGHFDVQGINGTHKCLIFEATGPPAYELTEYAGHFPALAQSDSVGERGKLPLWMAKKMIKDLVCAMHALHECGVVHGDLYLANMLLNIESLDEGVPATSIADESVYDCEEIRRKDGKNDKWTPKYMLRPKPLFERTDFSREGFGIKLSDLGQSFSGEMDANDVVTPDQYRPPEVYLGLPATAKIDVWSIGCLIFELVTGKRLFSIYCMGPDENNEDLDLDEAMTDFADRLESRMPASYAERWPHRDCYYDANWKKIRWSVEDPFCEEADPNDGFVEFGSVRYRFMKTRLDDVGHLEARHILKLLERMLSWLPEDRPSMAEIVEDPWIKSL